VKYLAILRDSFRETLDRKSFYFMVAIAAFLILFCAGISFTPLGERDAMAAILENFNLVRRARDPRAVWVRRYSDVAFELVDFRVEGCGERQGYKLSVKAVPAAQVNRLIRHWNGIRMGWCKEETDPVPQADEPVNDDLQKRFLAARFREALLPDAEIESSGTFSWEISVPGAGRRVLAGAEEMKLFFGAMAWRPRLPGPLPSSARYLSSAEMIYWIEIVMGEWMAGFLGLMIAVIVTAGSVPSMLQKGTLDLLLAKPMARGAILMTKYFGGCAQILLTSTAIIGGCWLALSARTGYWNFYFPLTILTLAFSFAVLYSVSVLMGVLTRSMAASAISAIVVWGLCYGVGQARVFLSSPVGAEAPAVLQRAVRFVHLLLPKTSDLTMLNYRMIAKGDLGRTPPELLLDVIPQLPLGMILFTSTLFALLMLLLAGIRFSKQDY
jgi:ABC-type transport system involved in multi-copper enzyme maturation permease subunit